MLAGFTLSTFELIIFRACIPRAVNQSYVLYSSVPFSLKISFLSVFAQQLITSTFKMCNFRIHY